MSKTYYWNLGQLSGSWTTPANWIEDPLGTTGKLPGPGDFAEIGSLTGPITVTLTTSVSFRSLALGGSHGFFPTLDIDGGAVNLAASAAGKITDSWSTTKGQSFSGGGTINLMNKGSLFVEGNVAAGTKLNFDGSPDILFIGGTTYGAPNPGTFAGPISGFWRPGRDRPLARRLQRARYLQVQQRHAEHLLADRR